MRSICCDCSIELSQHQRQSRKNIKKPFIELYNWKDIDFLSHKKDSKKFEWNNNSIALNILFLPYNTKEIRHTYKSQNRFKREN